MNIKEELRKGKTYEELLAKFKEEVDSGRREIEEESNYKNDLASAKSQLASAICRYVNVVNKYHYEEKDLDQLYKELMEILDKRNNKNVRRIFGYYM